MSDPRAFTAADAAARIAVPTAMDDKYSRGVLGVITGSERYPGAAVLGVDAALHTGVGMVRYLGPSRASQLVLGRRPEAVTADGRVQAWLIGSGTDAAEQEPATLAAADKALGQGVPLVLDGGALERAREASSPAIITPHHGELARLLGVGRADVTADPGAAATRVARELGVVVLLKGAETHIVGGGAHLTVTGAPAWLGTAGAGDALAGIVGALVATHADAVAGSRGPDAGSRAPDAVAGGPELLAELGAASVVIHSLAATRASGGGPFTITSLIEAIPATIAELLAPPRSAG
ncbi:NAD(P)H-hydrate dehydratase [Galbitalea sp. SE-J8]|uniref:ADP-dependent NAD(P)H-hydrate dehydratase n=1 Tax=Galbitalea sp. SE-J8 TaxID=3054952 RepID=UPI00259CDBA7|nr:ADP/ATP-dependent (S)-NAD(P)H-hydrate dehydratase [Galbitalea sp. SE-J8]MDM4764149.1 NAD(P)H-hydrate dehydratase [Galbitalea sp. SE-J8]